MLKKLFVTITITILFAFQTFVSNANAAELTKELRTLPLNDQGETVVVSVEQIAKGKKLFVDSCAQCHAGGLTKTNPVVNLGTPSLEGAVPNRNNIVALVDYLKNPTTYDGFEEIAEFHPSTKSADIFPEMRNLTDDDLANVSSYILLQPKVLGEQWGGGKSYRF